VTSEKLLALAKTAERFGQRPSQMLAITDGVLALEVDLAAAAALMLNERREDDDGVEVIQV
jgi:hypothetical protein